MPSLSSNDVARITDYVACELTPTDMAETERWIAADSARRAFVDYLQRSQNDLRKDAAAFGARIDVARNVRAITAEALRREKHAAQVGLPEKQTAIPHPPHLGVHPFSIAVKNWKGSGELPPQTGETAVAQSPILSLGTRPLPLASKIRGALGVGSLPLGTRMLPEGQEAHSPRPHRAGFGPHLWPNMGPWSRQWKTVSAAVGGIAIILLGVAFFQFDHPLSRSRIVTSRLYTTARAQQTTVRLDDQTTVVLAPETQLRYTVDRHDVQTVELTGEAFFTVTHRTSQLFTVRTGAIVTRVLGTAFDVRRYPDDRATRVAVVSGRVTTGGRMTPVILAAGMVGTVTDSSVAVNTGGEAERLASWRQGHLVFHNAPVPDVLAVLGRWYGYEFRLADTALAAGHISVGLSTEQPTEALDMLKAVLGVTMTFDGKIVTLRLDRDEGRGPRRQGVRELLGKPELEVGR